jgi:hypothetical protein
MALTSISGNPAIMRIALLILALFFLVFAYLVRRRRRLMRIWLEEQARYQQSSEEEAQHGPSGPMEQVSSAEQEPFAHSLLPQTSVSADILRGILILLSFAVALSLVMISLPQPAFDKVAESLRSKRSAPPPQESVAFLYLGDEAKGIEFHIRGAVRNISTTPVEQLDAVIRLYAPDRTLLETAVVRMDSEIIPPDAVATFHLTYPEYHKQFGSYSIDFKFRQGDLVPYKDMRATQSGP